MDWPKNAIVALLAVALCASLSGVAVAQAPADDPGAPDSDDAAALDDATRLARARSFYEAGSFDECRQSFADLLGPAAQRRLDDPKMVESARLYYAACLIALREYDAAEEQFEIALRANPLMAGPSQVVFPKRVVDFFFQVRSRLQTEIDQEQQRRFEEWQRTWQKNQRIMAELRARVAELEQQVDQELLVHKNRRYIAAIPFGVGQFQNGDDALGWLFLSSQALLAGTAITAVSIELGIHSQAEGGRTVLEDTDAPVIARNVSRLALVSWAVVALGGIIEAQLNFVPEVRLGERRRAPDAARKPGAVSLRPLLGGDSSLALLGLSGDF